MSDSGNLPKELELALERLKESTQRLEILTQQASQEKDGLIGQGKRMDPALDSIIDFNNALVEAMSDLEEVDRINKMHSSPNHPP